MKAFKFYLPAFKINGEISHGGDARSLQIFEKIKKNGKIIVIYPESLKKIIAKDLFHAWLAKIKWNLNWYGFKHYLRFLIAFRLKKAEAGDLCYFEHQAGPIRTGGMVALDLGMTVKCYPHNIESLANWGISDPLTGKKTASLFALEIKFFSCMEKLYLISKEELLLCKNLYLEAEYFPYSPPRALKKMHIKIKEKKRNPTSVVVFGSGVNQASYEGIIKIAEKLLKSKTKNLVVAGFGLEKMKPLFQKEKIQILSSLSPKDYCSLLLKTKTAIVHQERGCGVLTRIENLLDCGIPVIANIVAARDFYGRKNLFVYNDTEDISKILFHKINKTN